MSNFQIKRGDALLRKEEEAASAAKIVLELLLLTTKNTGEEYDEVPPFPSKEEFTPDSEGL